MYAIRSYYVILDLAGRGEEPAKPVPLTRDRLPEADPVWSRDGRLIYFVSQDPETRREGLFSIDVKTGARSPLLVENGVNPALSPDGRQLAYARGGSRGGLGILNLETGVQAAVTSSAAAVDMFPRWREDGRLIYFARYENDTNRA